MRRAAESIILAAAALAALSCAPDDRPSSTERGGSAAGGPERAWAAPGERAAELTPDGAWSWFGDPRAVTDAGRVSRTYVGWIDSRGSVQVASCDHGTGEIDRATLASELDVDDHANPSLIVHPDGRLVVFYSAHSGPDLFYRVSARPGDIAEWSQPLTIPGNTPGPNGYTYPNPVFLSDEGRLYLFWRGGDFHPCFASSDDWVHWSEVRPFIAGEGRRPYVKFATDGVATIHIAFTDGHPVEEEANSLYYLRYRDGSLFRADGTRICALTEVPVDPSDADLVYDAEATGVSSWVWDVAADSVGHPAIVYAVFPEGADHRYRYARWDGARWHDHEITAAGGWFSDAHVPSGARLARSTFLYCSGGLALDHCDPSAVYLSKPVDGRFEIERWTTPDAGATWTAQAITAGSAANNVRPVVPRNRAQPGPAVIWMHGEYVDFRRYSTCLRMR